MKRWKDLLPDNGLIEAFARAEPRPADSASRADKNKWSNRFADACAQMFANELRQAPALKKCLVFPDSNGKKVEFMTASGTDGKGKKVDVAVSTLSAGLQIALTLKGGNFPDPMDGAYGKNITGRIYELRDENRAIHEYHPHAPIIGVYYFPVAACVDRPKRSSFARVVANVRAVTGRADRSQVTQFDRLDWAVIGLYVPDEYQGIARGVVRYFDVFESPPKIGRPVVGTTMSTTSFVERVVGIFKERGVAEIAYADPEPDEALDSGDSADNG